jgi:hypothetical protein
MPSHLEYLHSCADPGDDDTDNPERDAEPPCGPDDEYRDDEPAEYVCRPGADDTFVDCVVCKAPGWAICAHDIDPDVYPLPGEVIYVRQ